MVQAAGPAGAIGDPQMALGDPVNGARAGSMFVVSGWAVDAAAVDGTSGVSQVHVWAYPNPGSGAPPIFLGSQSGMPRV